MRRVLLLAVAAVACGGGPEPVVTPPPLHVTAKPPAPPRARWVFSAPEQEIRAKLDLGDHKTLYVGEHGRRELDAGGELQHAPTLAEEALAGVLRDDKGKYVFVATDGDTYTSSEPLGALERVRPPRTERLASVTTGRAAILGISSGSLVRSTDWGATWKPVEYAGGKKPFGQAASVALDTKGNGVLVHLPQRLYVTHDDGATWAPLASPPRGAATTLRDGADRIFVIGYHDARATLAGDKLAETNDVPAAIFPGQPLFRPRTFTFDESDARPPFDPSLSLESEAASWRVLVGDHVVELASRDGKVTVRSAHLGEPLGAASAQPELDPRVLDANRVSASNAEIAYLRADAEDDDDATKTPTSTIFRSKDFGATWSKEDVFPGVPIKHARAIVLGPRGWTYIGPLCPSRRAQCKPPKIRPAGKQAFEDVAALDDFDARTVAFDEAHDKVYALASGVGGATLYEGTLGGSKLTRTSMLLPARADWVQMTVDDQGTLHLFEHGDGHRLTMHARTLKGEELPARYIELRDTALAFAGRRGIAVSNHASYETNDAGDTWTRVPSNGEEHGISCSAAGCLLEGAQRVGWDLPAVQSSEVVRAETTVPSERQPTKPPAKPPVTPVKIACKVSGKGTSIEDSEVNWIGGAGAARWARVSTDFNTGAVNISYADNSAVHRASLLGPKGPATMEVRSATDERDDGIVAARYRFARRSATGKLNPVQVELAWWSPTKAQVHRGTLQAVKPFRVSRFSFSGRARVVDGGVLFQGSRDDVIHFVHDDGKSETLASPGIGFEQAWRSGNHWVLLDADTEVAEMATSEDGGKTWALHGWAFGLMHGASADNSLEAMNGKLVMRAQDGLFEVAWPVPSDPPTPVVIDDKNKATRCDALTLGGATYEEHISGTSPVVMDLGGTTYDAADRIYQDSSTGQLCTSVYVMEQGRDRSAYLYPEKGGGWSGWSYRSTDEKTLAEPFTCK